MTTWVDSWEEAKAVRTLLDSGITLNQITELSNRIQNKEQ